MKRLIKWAGCAALLASPPAPAQTLSEVTGFGSNPGNLRMFKVVPSGLAANRPLVVALHGCAQSAAAYDAETGWVALANRWQFALLLPQQQSGNNSNACFNWFENVDISRGSGEALSIRQMVARMASDHGHDPARVYVTGLSAGGAMTSVMLATYPEVFAGGAIMAGLPYRCGIGTSAAFSCMNPGTNLTPAQWGDRVRAASTHTGPWPIVSIWHGDADFVVRPVNLTEAMEQWTNVHGVDQVAEVQDTLLGYPRRQYRDASGRTVVETLNLTGMGHGTAVDPGTGEAQCGTAGAYILDANICSSYWVGRFWGLDGGSSGGGGDPPPPPPPPPPTGNPVLSLASVAIEDGYTKANTLGSSAEVGTLESLYGLAIGRGSDSKFNRALLSFDTSQLPAGAEIVSVRLSLTHRGASGDPWASPAGNRLLIDLRQGCFGGDCALIASDHGAASTLDAVAEVPRFTSGAQDSAAFSTAALASINRSGRTQLRLRFEGNQSSTRYLWVGSGTQATLKIEYRLP